MLDALPPELLLGILHYLRIDNDLPFSLRLVCKRFDALTSPLAYSSITIGPRTATRLALESVPQDLENAHVLDPRHDWGLPIALPEDQTLKAAMKLVQKHTRILTLSDLGGDFLQFCMKGRLERLEVVRYVYHSLVMTLMETKDVLTGFSKAQRLLARVSKGWRTMAFSSYAPSFRESFP